MTTTALASTDLYAQGGGNSLEEVVVTAQFREQSVQETPLSITAVSSEMMEARAQTNVSELANQAPSVTMKPMPGGFGPSMGASIRGVGQYDFNPALEPGVGLYVDDVYYPTLTGSMFDLLDLERVEILRGPQGTLAGKNSIGGAVKLFSRKPSGEGGGFVSALMGDENRAEFRGSTDFAVTDNIAARLSGVFKSQDGYVDRIDFGCANPGSGAPQNTKPGTSCVLDQLGEVGYHAFRVMVNYDVSETLSFLLTADYNRDDRTNPGEVLVYGNNNLPGVGGNGVFLDSNQICGDFCSYGTYNYPEDSTSWFIPGITAVATYGSNKSTNEGWGSSIVADWQFSDNFSLKSISAYREYQTDWYQGGASAATVGNGHNKLDHWFLSQEFRISGQLSDSLFLTVGAYYSNQETVYYTLQDIRYISAAPLGFPNASFFPLQFEGDDPVDADAQALFVNLGWDFTDNLSLNLGARYTKESKDYEFTRIPLVDGVDPAGLSTLTGVVGSYEDEISDYRVALNYRFNDSVMVYTSIATGYKGGGINPRPFFAGQVQSFGPEELTAFELGVKGDFLDNRLRVNTAVFSNKYEDIQLTLLACPTAPCALPSNVADADVEGIELEAAYYPTEALMVDMSLSFLDFEYTDFPGSSVIGTLNERSPYTPEKKASLGIQYEFGLPGGSSLTPRIDAAYQSEMFTNATLSPAAPGQGDIDDYTVANFHLTWRNADQDLEASLEISNLTDEYYFLSKFDLTNAGAGSISGVPARPREWAFSLRKNF